MRILRSILFVMAVMLLVSIMAAHGQNTGTTGDPVATLKTGLIGGSDGTNLRSISVDSSGRLIVTSPSGSSSNQVQGTAAAGATPVGNPVQIGGSDGTNMQVLRTDTSGRQVAVGAAATGASVVGSPVYIAGIDPSNLVRPIRVGSNGDVSNLQTFASNATSAVATGNFLGMGTTGGGSGGLNVAGWGFDGTTFTINRLANLATMPTSVTTTARNALGAQVGEFGSRFIVNSAPAAGSQASASIASEASVRHVATGLCFSSGSTTAPVLTSLQVNLRDGATGAGTVLASFEVEIPAATGVDTAPFCTQFTGGIVGTTATAMTVEWSASLANLKQTATLIGYNVN